MKKNIFLFLFLVVLGSCSNSAPAPGDVAGQTARQYYDYLLHGDVEAYVAGMDMPDTIPPVYREQLVTNARMFLEQQQQEHRGIREVRFASAKADTARRVAQVFLTLAYGDSIKEEIVVPMIWRRGVWYMR